MAEVSPPPRTATQTRAVTRDDQRVDHLSGAFAGLLTEQGSGTTQNDEEDYILDHYYVAGQGSESSMNGAGELELARSRSASSSHGSALSDQAPSASSPGTSTASDDGGISGKRGAQWAEHTDDSPTPLAQRQVVPPPLLIGKQLPPRTSSRRAAAVVAAMKQDSPLPSAHYTASLNPPVPFSGQVSPPPRAAHKPPLLHSFTAPPEIPPSAAYAGSDCSTTPSTATSAFSGLSRGDSSGGPAKRRSDVAAGTGYRGSFEAWRQRQRYSVGGNDTAKDFFTDSQPPSALVRNFAPLSPVRFAGPCAITPSIASTGAARPNISHRKTHSGVLAGEGVRKRTSCTPAKRLSGIGAVNPSPSPTAGINTPQLTQEDLKSFEDFGARVVQRPSLSSLKSGGSSFSTPLGSPQAGYSGREPPLKRYPSTSSATSRNSRGSLSPEFSLTSSISRHGSTSSRSKKRSKVQPTASGGLGQCAQVVSPTLTRNLSTSMRMTCAGDQAPCEARGIEPEELADRLARSQAGKGKQKDRDDEATGLEERKVLVIDGRSLANYLSPIGRIASSINVNFPSLLVKRFRKGNTSSFQLEAFITTEQGKRHFQSMFGSSGGSLDNVDIVIVDEHLDEREVTSNTSTLTGVILLSVMQRLSSQQERKGDLMYLRGKFGLLAEHPALGAWMTQGEPEGLSGAPVIRRADKMGSLKAARGLEDGPKQGLLRLQPSGPTRSLPRIEMPQSGMRTPLLPPRKDSLGTPGSSPQSGSSGGKPKPPRLRRIDTSETLLGINARLTPPRPSDKVASPAGLTPPLLDIPNSRKSLQEICASQSRTPTLNAFGADVHAFGVFPSTTASHAITPAPTAHPETVFSCSTIIPGFLFLGSEPCKASDYEELETLDVKRIMNMALECTDEEEECVRRFEKYHFVPLRDFVEEVGVQARIDEANKLLDDASLHSAPVYVHCKAGKSRSVTIVLAYLIHRYRWSLKRAYAHVADRRKGMCPNIGFLSELMKFEERELGGKSNGVASTGLTPATAGSASMNESGSYFNTDGGDGILAKSHVRRHHGNHARESMPAAYHSSAAAHGFSSDHAMEVRRPCDGTWRPARQDPSSDRFLVTRRQSKAGLESAMDDAAT